MIIERLGNNVTKNVKSKIKWKENIKNETLNSLGDVLKSNEFEIVFWQDRFEKGLFIKDDLEFISVKNELEFEKYFLNFKSFYKKTK